MTSSVFYKEAKDVASRAMQIASERQHEIATLEHVLYALTEFDEIKKFFEDSSIDITVIRDLMESVFESELIPKGMNTIMKSKPFHLLFTRVIGFAKFSQTKVASAMDVLLCMTQMPHEDSYAITALLRTNVTSLKIKQYLTAKSGAVPSTPIFGNSRSDFGDMGSSDAEPSNRDEAIKYLKKYGTDLNQLAKEGKIDPLIGRADELKQIIQITARRTKNNCILVGEAGVGKTALIEGLAYKIVNNEVPEILKNITVYSLDIGALVAGTRFRGDFEERMKLVLKALTYVPDTFLFIDEIHTIMDAGTGSKGSLDVANLLKPALAKGQLRCIGSTTSEEYRKHIEKDRALSRRFKKVTINEPSPELTKVILRGLKDTYEKFHGVVFSDEALDAAVDLTHKFVTTALLPDKAIDIIDNVGANQRILSDDEKIINITVKEVEEEVSKITKIPAKNISESEEIVMKRLEDDLKGKVFGQNEAIYTLVDCVFIARAGLKDSKKPAGSYLFVGPTGVGKSETAKQLAKSLNIPLIKFDCSEYMEKHSVSKFIGSPPGYVGYGEGGAGNGLLVNAIDTNPSCVLLLDEIEKAHEDIFNVLLQVMDDAILTNSAGKSVNFRNVYLIMTSNAGVSLTEKSQIGFSKSEEINDIDEKAIKNLFRPEFRNRLDSVVKFNRLKFENMMLIVDKFLDELRVLAENRSVVIEISQPAKEWLAREGYAPIMGARPLARVINDYIKKPLAKKIVLGDLKYGGKVVIDLINNQLEII